MVYPLSGVSPALASDLPWFWRTAITCPRCGFGFYLTAEETLPGVVANLGASGTLALGWKQVVEGDPTTAVIDTAHLHVDPAQVVGHCPQCGFNPVSKQGPHYGTTKTSMNTDPVPNPMQGYLAAGATSVAFWLLNDGTEVAIYLHADGSWYQVDSTGSVVLSAHWHNVDTPIYPSHLHSLLTPGGRVMIENIAKVDADFYARITAVGFTVL